MSILKVFNTHLVEFLDDFQTVINSSDLKTAILFINTTKKINPSMFIKGWNTYINITYKSKIESGDFTFFLEKNYSNDVEDDNKILDIINTIRFELKNLDEKDKKKVIKYVQNLTKICEMYKNK